MDHLQPSRIFQAQQASIFLCCHIYTPYKSATIEQRNDVKHLRTSESNAIKKLIAAVAFLLFLGIVMIGFSGCLHESPALSTAKETSTESTINPSLEQNTIESLVELRGIAYALRRDGSLLVKNRLEPAFVMIDLSADRIVTDGSDLYYAKDCSIFELDVHTKASSEIWRAESNLRLISISQEWFVILKETANGSTQFDLCTVSRKSGKAFVIEPNKPKYYDVDVLSADDRHVLLRGEDNSLVVVGLDGSNRTRLHDGPIESACLLDEKIWFATMQILPGQQADNPVIPPRFYSIGINGDNLLEQETSGEPFAWIRVTPFGSLPALLVQERADRSGNTVMNAETGLSVLVVNPENGAVTRRWKTNDWYSGFHATEHYYCGARMEDTTEQFTLVFEQFPD